MGSEVEDLRRVGAGLRLVFLGLVVVVINTIAAVGVAVTMVDTTKPAAAMITTLYRDHPTAVMVLIGLGVLSNVLAITGKVFCLSTPTEAQASQFIIMAVACGGIGLTLNVIGQVPDLGPTALEFTQTSPLFTIVGFVFFLRFLRRLASYLGSPGLMLQGARIQFGTLALILVYLIASIGAAAGMMSAATVVVALMIAVGGLALFVMYGFFIHAIRRTAEGAAAYLEES